MNIGANVSGRIVAALRQGGRSGEARARCWPASTSDALRGGRAPVRGRRCRRRRADLDRAHRRLEVARLAFERTKKMHDGEARLRPGATTRPTADFKMKPASVESQRRRIAQLQAAARPAPATTSRKTTVVSPMDGVVTSLPKEEGEVVIGAQSFSPTVIMTVADLSVMECEIMVDETDIRNVDAGPGGRGPGRRPRRRRASRARSRRSARRPWSARLDQTAADRPRRRNTAQPGQGLQGHDHPQGPAGLAPPGPERDRRHHDRARGERGRGAHPGRGGARGRQGRQGRRSRRASRPPERAATPAQARRARRRSRRRTASSWSRRARRVFRPVKTGIIGDTDIEIAEGLKEGEEIVTGSYKTLRTLKDEAQDQARGQEQEEALMSAEPVAAVPRGR